MATKKRKKLDPRFVSSQRWELRYIATKFGIKPEQVLAIKKQTGKSRIKVYRAIRELLDNK